MNSFVARASSVDAAGKPVKKLSPAELKRKKAEQKKADEENDLAYQKLVKTYPDMAPPDRSKVLKNEDVPTRMLKKSWKRG